MNQQRLWTGNFILGTTFNLFLMLNYYLLMVTVTTYTLETYHTGHSLAGLTSSIFVIGVLASRFFCGKWMSIVNRRAMLTAGAVFGTAVSSMYLIQGNVASLLIIRVIHGFTYGACTTVIGTIVTSQIPSRRQGEGIGYYMLSITLGTALGPFLANYLLRIGTYQTIFVVGIVIDALCILELPFIKTVSTPVPYTASDSRRFCLTDYIELKAIPISLICVVVYFCYSGILSFLTPFSRQNHLEQGAQAFFLLYSMAILFSRPFTGRVFDRFGAKAVMVPSLLSFVLGMVLLSISSKNIGVFAAACFIGFGVGTLQSSGLALAIRTVSPERIGLANSTFYIALDAGIGIGPMILGLIIPWAGYRGMYLGLALITLLCVPLYYVLPCQGSQRRNEKQSQEALD